MHAEHLVKNVDGVFWGEGVEMRNVEFGIRNKE